MSGFTPTTQMVRESYVFAAEGFAYEAYEQFDRWLGEHDAKVRADIAERIRADIEIVETWPYPEERHAELVALRDGMIRAAKIAEEAGR